MPSATDSISTRSHSREASASGCAHRARAASEAQTTRVKSRMAGVHMRRIAVHRCRPGIAVDEIGTIGMLVAIRRVPVVAVVLIADRLVLIERLQELSLGLAATLAIERERRLALGDQLAL